MNPISVISAISAIASLLSIIFDVPNKQKISVSFKTFILILSVVSFLFIGIFSPYFKDGPPGKPDTIPNESDPISQPTSTSMSEPASDPINDPITESSTNPSDGIAIESTEISTDKPINTPQNLQILQVEPIAVCQYEMSSIVLQPSEASPIEIEQRFGIINETGQSTDYEFIPKVSGAHRFEFSDVPDGIDLRLEIYNSGWERIKSDYDLDNGDGLTVSLSADCLYYLRVQQYRGLGSYTLNIGPKKSTVDISSVTSISDSIQYTNQENDYAFFASVSGTYRFEFSDVPNGTDLRLEVYNSGWERLKSDYDLDNGDGLTVSLSAGSTYFLRVQQYRSLGAYTLNIGLKKAIANIPDATAVSDSIQYTDQQNDYSFTAKISGTYRFEFSDVPDGTDFRLEIYNSGWEKIKSDYDLDDGDGLTVSLVEGESYYLRVQQYRNLGSYILNIGAKKPIINISKTPIVSDTIQYTNQENDYLFSTEVNGTFRFEFSDVPDGTDLRLEIYNSGWEKIKSDYDLDNGDGLTVSLSSKKEYFIRVSYYRGYGNYLLYIGLQNK